MVYYFLGIIPMNESEYLTASAVGSATIGWPDFKTLVIESFIKNASQIDSFLLFILLYLKLILAISSFYWIYKVFQNMEFTYNRHTTQVFNNYLVNLVFVAIATFIVATILRIVLF